MYRCPKCKSDRLEVTVEVWATLTQTRLDDGFEAVTAIPEPARHEWNQNSVMRCVACDHHAIADEFETPSTEVAHA
jgi:hypothetical protein